MRMIKDMTVTVFAWILMKVCMIKILGRAGFTVVGYGRVVSPVFEFW